MSAGGPRATFALLFAVFLFVVALGTTACGQPEREAPPILATLGDFAFVDQHGEPVTRATLAGRPFVADFVFTHCPSLCPRLTARMKELRETLPKGTNPRFVSISVDPERDTPEVLAEYAEKWEIRDPRWLFVTGERAAVWELVQKGFLLPVEAQDDPANPVLHSNRFALVDAAGNLRGTYEAFDDEAVERMLADLVAIGRLEGEARK